MKFDRTGIILYVLEYKKCILFYEKILELTKMFETKDLTCFKFGDSYLMVELDDEFHGTPDATTREKSCLRMNVASVKEWTQKLKTKMIDVDYQEHPWGTVAKFYDPDGNLLAFKDSHKFENQIASYKSHRINSK